MKHVIDYSTPSQMRRQDRALALLNAPAKRGDEVIDLERTWATNKIFMDFCFHTPCGGPLDLSGWHYFAETQPVSVLMTLAKAAASADTYCRINEFPTPPLFWRLKRKAETWLSSVLQWFVGRGRSGSKRASR